MHRTRRSRRHPVFLFRGPGSRSSQINRCRASAASRLDRRSFFEPLEPRLLLNLDWGQEDPGDVNYVDGEVLVALRTQDPITDVNAFLSQQSWPDNLGELMRTGFQVDYRYASVVGTQLTVGCLDLPDGMSERQVAAQLATFPQVEWAHPNYLFDATPELIPNDPALNDPANDYAKRWHLEKMSVFDAWAIQSDSSNVMIAVLDSGIDIEQNDLAANVWTNNAEVPGNKVDDDHNGKIDDIHGWDFYGDDADVSSRLPSSGGDHGTAVAGIAAARMNNGIGSAGVAGTSPVLPVRINNNETVSARALSNAIVYAYNMSLSNPIDHLVINLSQNLDKYLRQLKKEGVEEQNSFVAALDYAYEQGVLIVASAGNQGAPNTPRQQFGQVLFVAATDQDDHLWTTKNGGSNYGWGIDLAAPGEAIYTITGQTVTGTSVAAPNVAGVAALVWAHNPDWTRDQVVAQLMGTAIDISNVPGNSRYGDGLGNGRVDAYKALVTAQTNIPQAEVTDVRFTRKEDGLISAIKVHISQALDPTTVNPPASAPSNIVLVEAGPDRTLGTSDDIAVPLVVERYYVGDPWVTLRPQDGLLGAGSYRLVLKAGITNPFGRSILPNSTDFEVTSGGTGDLISVALKELFGGTQFSNLLLNSVDPGYAVSRSSGSPQQYLMSDGSKTEPVGKVMSSDDLLGTSFTQTGQFFFAPEPHAELTLDSAPDQLGFQGTIRAQVDVDGVTKYFSICVHEGYATLDEYGAVTTPPDDSVDRLRIEQRLAYLGFPGSNGTTLDVQPDNMEDTWAVGLFNSAAQGTALKRVPSLEVDPTYINSSAAPHWIKLENTPGVEIVDLAGNDQVWATDWARDVLTAAGKSLQAAGQPSLKLLRASAKAGGETTEAPGPDHDGGMNLDIDTVADEQTNTPFYLTRTIGTDRYVAAKTNTDPTGQTHLINRIVARKRTPVANRRQRSMWRPNSSHWKS